MLVGTVFAIRLVLHRDVTAATLHRGGIQVQLPRTPRTRVQPLAGVYAEMLFAIGLFGASC